MADVITVKALTESSSLHYLYSEAHFGDFWETYKNSFIIIFESLGKKQIMNLYNYIFIHINCIPRPDLSS